MEEWRFLRPKNMGFPMKFYHGFRISFLSPDNHTEGCPGTEVDGSKVIGSVGYFTATSLGFVGLADWKVLVLGCPRKLGSMVSKYRLSPTDPNDLLTSWDIPLIYDHHWSDHQTRPVGHPTLGPCQEPMDKIAGFRPLKIYRLLPSKLTKPLKINGWKMYFLLKIVPLKQDMLQTSRVLPRYNPLPKKPPKKWGYKL